MQDVSLAPSQKKTCQESIAMLQDYSARLALQEGSTWDMYVDMTCFFAYNMQGLQVFFRIGDALLVNNGFSSSVLIDSVPIDIDVPVGTSSPRPSAVYTGTADIAQINVSFKVRCIGNYTGSDCLTLCPDSRSSCDECGLPDFTGDFCQFDADNCNGTVCSASANNNSLCIRRDEIYTCICSPGYTGDDCGSLVDHCANVTCSGINGGCVNSLEGPTCVCDAGFTGDWCEVDVDECEQSTSPGCSGKGRCVDGVNSFLCECEDGYIGLHCERQGNVEINNRDVVIAIAIA